MPEGLVDSIERMGQATIRIEATGTFVDSDAAFSSDMDESVFQGSGFIFDPSGLALTNNHVVAGAGLVHVWLEGDDSPRTAQILGRSECSDLAVIDLSGDGYNYLELSTSEIWTGQKIYAAGFPNGSVDLTMTSGIISKRHVTGGGNHYWASLDHELEHDARLNPGSSGGPLVTEDAKVVGINYADDTETDQSYAISVEEAASLLSKLASGEDIDGIGISGEAVYDNLIDTTGIWVGSVDSGSAADNAGLKPGDIVTHLEGISLAPDYTMSNYCELLESHEPSDVMSIEVFRPSSQEFLEGRLNGTPLTSSSLFVQQVVDLWNTTSDFESDPKYNDGYTFYDDSSSLTVWAPTNWVDWSGAPIISPNYPYPLGPYMDIAPNLDDFYSGWGMPGLAFGATRNWTDLEYPEVIARLGPDGTRGCVSLDEFDYEDVYYTGIWQFSTCPEMWGSIVIILSAAPVTDQWAYTSYLIVQLGSISDLAILKGILDTFYVDEDF